MEKSIQIIDNEQKLLCDVLKELLNEHSEVSVLANSFSVFAYEGLKDTLDKVKSFRFLFLNPTFTSQQEDEYIYNNAAANSTTISSSSSYKSKMREFYIPKLNREHNIFGNDLEIRLRNQMTQKTLCNQCSQWIEAKGKFHTMLSYDQKNLGYIMVKNPDETWLISGIGNFDAYNLGLTKANHNELFSQTPFTFGPLEKVQKEFASTFNLVWSERHYSKDITQKVLDSFKIGCEEVAPEIIYYQTLNCIFSEFLEENNEDYLPNDATGYQNSVIWQMLYPFQKDAALAIINKLEKYNGCILADSVGLGKTFTALAVIKYYQTRNKNILVLCPKKLEQNWKAFNNNYHTNILEKDRFNYDVLFHTDLNRNKGESNGIDLSLFNWSSIDLIVIDESHNFRNGGKKRLIDEDSESSLNRYDQLLQKAIKPGVKTKVLMLSATPVNNRFNDLKNQIALAYEGNSADINSKLGTSSGIDEIFKLAQKAYNSWAKSDVDEQSTQHLIDKLPLDFFKVLDAVTIARSRHHIETFYDASQIGSFPTRLSPSSLNPAITDLDKTLNFQDLFNRLSQLSLAVYTPSNFLLPNMRSTYEQNGNFKFSLDFQGREQGLARLMTINLFKRLESSIHSLRLTINKLIDHHTATLDKIDSFQLANHKASQKIAATDLSFDDDIDEVLDEDLIENGYSMELDNYVGSKKAIINLQDMDLDAWRKSIATDKEILETLIAQLNLIDTAHDLKLKTLVETIANKRTNPINPGNLKVLVFTAFADTALYLYENLVKHFNQTQDTCNLALITGGKSCKSTIKGHSNDFDALLTMFSPKSKQRDKRFGNNHNANIDLLIASDCISEGQNLQDCDYLINYDIHWNPVRLIQRFGRIDRIGSTNKFIKMVNFWPDLGLDEYIHLRARVEQKMKLTVMTATGDDNLISQDDANLDYRSQQLRRIQKETVNLEEMNCNISITDLGLSDFRQDLLSYVKTHNNLERMPFGLNALVQVPSTHQTPAITNPFAAMSNPFAALMGSNETPSNTATEQVNTRIKAAQELGISPGTILILRNRNNDLKANKRNIFHPFYMVYLGEDNKVICNHFAPKRMLEILRFLCRNEHVPNKALCDLFNKETNDGMNMTRYSSQLQHAIQQIINEKQTSDLDSLFGKGESSALHGAFSGSDDFELLGFVVVRA